MLTEAMAAQDLESIEAAIQSAKQACVDPEVYLPAQELLSKLRINTQLREAVRGAIYFIHLY